MHAAIDATFRDALREYGHLTIEQIEQSANVVFGLTRDHRISYVNPAYRRFAEENNGEPGISRRWSEGARLFEAIPGALRGFYRHLFNMAADAKGRPVQHAYECSSPTSMRKFLMTIQPLPGCGGWLVVHALTVERPHDPAARPAKAADRSVYEHDDGLLHQCIGCRCTQMPGAEGRWDWVPEWVREMPRDTSHGLCDFCVDQYFRQAGLDLKQVAPA